MMKRIAEASPRFKARMAGVFFSLTMLTAAFTELVGLRKLSLAADVAAGMVELSGMVAVTLLFYPIFKPVSRSLSLLAASFNLVGLTLEALKVLNAGLVFHGIYCLLIGCLIFRSTFLPRILGAPMTIAGLCFLTFLSTPLANLHPPYNLAAGLVGEGLAMLWLLVMGVNVQRWKEQAARRESRRLSPQPMEWLAETSPRLKARIAGVFYLITFVAGVLALVSANGRLAANIIATVCYVAVTLLFYGLFKPVSRSISLLAAFFSLVGLVVGTLSMFHLAPFKINNLVFFGVYCLLIGYLIFRSIFLPRILGALMAFGGLGWLTFLSPQLAKILSPYNLAPGIFGEGVLTLWLLAVGLNEQRWKEQAAGVAIRERI